MSKARQSQVWWVRFPTPTGRRPAVILTRGDAIKHLSSVTIAPLTRHIRHIDSEVVLSPAHGLPSICAVSLDNITTVPKDWLDRPIVDLDSETMGEVFAAIRFAFNMN